MALLRHENKRGVFGSLNTGIAATELPEDESPRKENIEHPTPLAATKRRGRTLLYEVADIDNVRDDWPRGEYSNGKSFTVTSSEFGGSYNTVTATIVAVTYLTDMGETDSGFCQDAQEILDFPAIGTDARVYVHVRYHIEERVVKSYQTTGGTVTMTLEADDFLSAFPVDCFIGFRLFPRDPRAIDETKLGANQDGLPLWNKAEPVAIVSDYDKNTRTFTLNRMAPVDLTGMVVDLLMPDHDGQKIRGYNVYVDDGGNNGLRYMGTGRSILPVVIDSNPTGTEAQPPDSRIDRSAATLAAFTPKEVDPNDGRRLDSESGLLGGFYRFRHCWRLSDPAVMTPPGTNNPPLTVPRQCWPSARRNIAINDGQAIRATLPDTPDGVGIADAILMKLPEDVLSQLDGVTNPSGTHRIYKNTASITNIDSLSPAQFRADPDVTEISTAEYTALADMDEDSTVDLAFEENKFQCELQISAGDHAKMLRAIWDNGRVGLNRHPSAKTQAGAVTFVARFQLTRGTNYNPKDRAVGKVRVRDHAAASWVNVKTSMEPKKRYLEMRFCVDYGGFSTTDPRENGRLVFEISTESWVGISLAGLEWEVHWADSAVNYASIPSRFGSMPVQDGEVRVKQGLGVIDIQNPIPNSADWTPRTNTTAEWLVDLFNWEIPGGGGKIGQKARIVVASGGAVFIRGSSPTGLIRIYQGENDLDPSGNPRHAYLSHDWQFASYLDRLIFVHPQAESTLIFDTVSTRPIGMPAPVLGGSENIRLMEKSGLVQGNHHYYYVYLRQVTREDGYGYVVTSEPVLIGQVKGLIDGTVRLSVPPPSEPWVTHIAFGRTRQNGSQPFLVQELPVDGNVDNDGFYSVEDDLPDNKLILAPFLFETARPEKADTLLWLAGRLFFSLGDRVRYTNIADANGNLDPEGAALRNGFVPRLPKNSTITALSDYTSDTLVVHSDNGGVIYDGISEDVDDPGAFSGGGYSASFGAAGPKASDNSEELHAMITREGPAVLLGQEGRQLTPKVRGTWRRVIKDRGTLRFFRVLHYRGNGKSQVIFPFAKQDDANHRLAMRALVLELPTGNEDDPRKGKLWSEWTDWPCHGLVMAEDECGEDILLVGDHWGRVHRADWGGTDNGLFISCRHDTKPYDENEHGLADQLRFMALTGKALHKDQYVFMNAYPGGDDQAFNERPYRFDFTPEHGTAVYYEDGYSYDDSHEFLGNDDEWQDQWVEMGGISDRWQYSFFQDMENLPPGAPLDSEMELTAFNIFSRQKEPRLIRKPARTTI